MQKQYQIDEKTSIPFRNAVTYCVGTGRMGLALQKEYMDQLALVQSELGFSYIRGHGLFSDDMAIYQEYQDASGKTCVEYNFTYLDLVMDGYRTLGLRPFLELGFMPGKLASGEQTIFYWKGNVTPPKTYEGWCALVQATLRHLCERYGRDEVVTWPIEVWNEPNLSGFWKDADMEEYFKLFQSTFYAVKEVDERFRGGGPAICGVDEERWMKSFLAFCEEKEIPVDFITRHHYTTEEPESIGLYVYAKLMDAKESLKTLQNTRSIVDGFVHYKGHEIHITEFNTSYIPNCPLHDTNQNAAYIAGQLSCLGDANASYSYWTFGDVFEENGLPFAPFHGGFGLVGHGGLPKHTLWPFVFFKELGSGTCVHRTEDCVIVKKADGSYRGIAWNSSRERTGEELQLTIQLPLTRAAYVLLTRTVDEETCNPLKVWHDFGEPTSLTTEQKKLLKEAAHPFVRTQRLTGKDGRAELALTVKEHGVCYFEVKPVCAGVDRGYDYNRVMQL